MLSSYTQIVKIIKASFFNALQKPHLSHKKVNPLLDDKRFTFYAIVDLVV